MAIKNVFTQSGDFVASYDDGEPSRISSARLVEVRVTLDKIHARIDAGELVPADGVAALLYAVEELAKWADEIEGSLLRR